MSWAKIDDRFHENRKIKTAWHRCPAAVGLHVMALSYCSGHETDGFVDASFVREKVPDGRKRKPIVAALVAAGLWTVVTKFGGESTEIQEGYKGESIAGWQVNDYLDFNPSRAELDERRRSDADRKAKGRAHGAHRPPGHKADVARIPPGVREESNGPVPSRPVNTPHTPQGGPPTKPSGDRLRDRQRYEQELRTFAHCLLPDLPESEAYVAVKSVVSTPPLVHCASVTGEQVLARINVFQEGAA